MVKRLKTEKKISKQFSGVRDIVKGVKSFFHYFPEKCLHVCMIVISWLHSIIFYEIIKFFFYIGNSFLYYVYIYKNFIFLLD